MTGHTNYMERERCRRDQHGVHPGMIVSVGWKEEENLAHKTITCDTASQTYIETDIRLQQAERDFSRM